MRVINKKNKRIYNYLSHSFSDGVVSAIILFAIAVVLMILSFFVSFLFMGEAPTFIAGIGISSILFNTASMINIILEIYLYRNFHIEIRTMLLLQLILYTIWIFII